MPGWGVREEPVAPAVPITPGVSPTPYRDYHSFSGAAWMAVLLYRTSYLLDFLNCAAVRQNAWILQPGTKKGLHADMGAYAFYEL